MILYFTCYCSKDDNLILSSFPCFVLKFLNIRYASFFQIIRFFFPEYFWEKCMDKLMGCTLQIFGEWPQFLYMPP